MGPGSGHFRIRLREPPWSLGWHLQLPQPVLKDQGLLVQHLPCVRILRACPKLTAHGDLGWSACPAAPARPRGLEVTVMWSRRAWE